MKFLISATNLRSSLRRILRENIVLILQCTDSKIKKRHDPVSGVISPSTGCLVHISLIGAHVGIMNCLSFGLPHISLTFCTTFVKYIYKQSVMS